GQVVDPLEAQIGMQHVDAVVWQWQCAGFGADTGKRLQPAAVLLRRAQHRQGQVERDHLGLGIALLEQGAAEAGAGTHVEHALWRALMEAETLQQMRLYLALQGVVLFVGGRRVAEMTTHQAAVEVEITHRKDSVRQVGRGTVQTAVAAPAPAPRRGRRTGRAPPGRSRGNRRRTGWPTTPSPAVAPAGRGDRRSTRWIR